jgi:3-oxoacyl-[acyl-carrier protein] reductase
MQQRPLDGQVMLAVGGAGGIGSAICRAYADAGARVLVGYHSNAAAGEEALASLPGEGHEALQIEAEDSAALAALASDIEARHGRLDVLINLAGYTQFVPHDDLDALSDEIIDTIFRVNWRCTFATIRACKALLAAGDGGLVINVSSIAGKTAMGSNVAYCAAKAAVDTMTRSLARALAPQIRVCSVAPGLVDTAFALRFDPAWRQEQIDKTPIGRLVAPEEVAGAALALATHITASTGDIIAVDGGRPLT